MDLTDDDSEASGPTTSEVLLFLTLPASASPLSSSLMPRRHRERILEFTKTVTVTEVVNNSLQCHPGTCEVTVTNLDSGSGHPVSVNISHLHETVCQENGSGRCSPVVHVIESMEEGATTEQVEEISQQIEHYLRVETEGDVTFKRRGDNVVDLSFTTPVKPGVLSEINNPDKTLYYHSLKKETVTEAAHDLISPDSAVSSSPKRYMQSDDSDSGSMIIHSPAARPDSGVSSSVNRALNGKNLSISVGSSEEDDLHFQEPSADGKQEKNVRLPYYIVTSMSETVSSHCSPNTTTFFADLDTSGTTATVTNDTTMSESKPKFQKRGSEDKEKRRSILVVTNVSSTPAEKRTTEEDSVDYYRKSDWNDSLPSSEQRRRITMEVLFTPPTPKDNGVPPKPPRRAKYGSSQIVEHVQLYEHSLDDMTEGPNMTSTPISTLERHARKSVNVVSEINVKDVSVPVAEETPVKSPRKISKPPALKPLKPEQREQPLASPRRSPSSPIIVVDQDRRSSMDLLVPPKQPRRKSTITDIDWFAAFNMKEPTTPKSPRSPMAVDALREVENAVIERKKRRTVSYDAKPLAPSNINLDDIFSCQNKIEKDDNKCTCNACTIMKMSEEELKMRFNSLRKSPTFEERPILGRSRSVEDEKPALYADSDISLEDIFAPRRSRIEDAEHFKYYAQVPAEAREAPPVLSTNSHTEYHSITEFSSSDNEFKAHNNHNQSSKPDISHDDVIQKPSLREHLEEMETTVSHQKLSSTYEVVRSTPSSPRASIQLGVVHPADMERKAEVTSDISLDDVFAIQPSSAQTTKKEWTPRRVPVEEPTLYMARRGSEVEKPRVKPSEYVDSDISLDDVFATEASKNRIYKEFSNSNTSTSYSRSASAENQTADTNKGATTSDGHVNSTSSKTEEGRDSTVQMVDISMEEIFAKQPELPQQKLRKGYLKPIEDEQPTYAATKRSDETKQEKRLADYKDSYISLEDVFIQTAPAGSEKKAEEEKLNIDSVFELPKSEEKERRSPPPEHEEPGNLQHIQEVSTSVVFVEHMEPQKKAGLKPEVLSSQEISLDDVFNSKKKKDLDSENEEISIDKLFSPEKPQETRTRTASNTCSISSLREDEKSKPDGYQDSDISLEDVFETKLSRTEASTENTADINLEEVFSPKAPQEQKRPSPPPEQEVQFPKSLLEEPSSLLFVVYQKPNEKEETLKQEGDNDLLSLDDVFQPKPAGKPSSQTSINLEDVFSMHSEESQKQKSAESKSTIESTKVIATRTEEKKTAERHAGYVDSDISLDDVFALSPAQDGDARKPLLEEPVPVFFVEHENPEEHSEKPEDNEDSVEISLVAKQASTAENNIDEVISAPSISSDRVARSEARAAASNYHKTEETKTAKRPADYVDSDISLDDVFVDNTKAASEKKLVGKTPSASAILQQADDNKKRYTDPEIDISQENVFVKSERVTDNVQYTLSSDLNSSSKKRTSSEEKSPATPVQDVSWLEELLTQNLQPNEKELQDPVQKLHDNVLLNEQLTSKADLNETAESGYTSLDRSKTSADRSQDVSFADHQVGLDAVFNPIRSDSREVRTSESAETPTSSHSGQMTGKKMKIDKGTTSDIDKTQEEEDTSNHIIPSEEYRIENTSKSRVAVESRKESFSEINTMRETESAESSSQSGETPENQRTPSSIGFSWIESVIQSEEISRPTTHPKTTNVISREPSKEHQTTNPSTATVKESAPKADFSWIQSMIEESKKTAKAESNAASDDSSSEEETPPAEDIIEKVFGTPCDSVEKGKSCTCSACQLTNMSFSELKEFWRRMKKQETQTIPPTEGKGSSPIISKDDRTETLAATVDFEDVFERKFNSTSGKLEAGPSAKSEEVILDRHCSRDASPARPVAPQKTDGQRSVLADDVPFMVDLNDIFSTPSTSTKKDSKTVKEKKKTADSRKTEEQNKKNIDEQEFSVHKEAANTDDSWIQDIIGNDVTEPEEADTFEASYLQSIKETQNQNMDDAGSYDNYYWLQTAVTQAAHHTMRHVDDYYDEPEDDEESVEDIDVGDLVNDILSSSMNEAVFRVAAKNYNREEAHRTDTSVDRKTELQQQMYLSTAASDNRMESILSYPPSTSSPTTPHPLNTSEKFISEASVMLSAPPDEDYLIRLIFANNEVEQPVMPNLSNAVVMESEVVTPSDSASNLYETSRNSRVMQSERHSHHTMTKIDEEILEVEVNKENFIIKGNYVIVINKHDPLGVLLSELTSNSSALDFPVTPKIRRLLLQCLKEKAKPNIGKSLSSRAREILCRTDPAYKVFYQMQERRYTKENTTGNINLCTAENNVCNDMVEERFRQHPELFVPNYEHILHYGPPGGHSVIKSGLCEYLRNEHGGDVQEELLVLLPSGNATYDLLCHCLFDSDDVILTNTPTYSRNFVNVSDRAQCHLAPVDFDLQSPRIDIAAYERAFVERTEQGENVKAVIVINPHNPTGIVHSAEELTKLAHWAYEKNLWLLVDESFSQCIHDPNTEFTSFLALQMKLPVNSAWFWSLSKDFGLPGVRLSMVHTNNRDLHYALGQLELTEPVSSLAQDFVSNFLSDKQWLSTFEGDKLRRIRAHYKFVTENLDNLGIPYIRATAGIFVFVDFSKKLSSNSFESEEEFFNSLIGKGIFMTPGSHCKCSQPGWMRLVFACDKDQLFEAFRRFYEFFDNHLSIVGEINY